MSTYLVARGEELKTVSARCRSSSSGGMLSGQISFDKAEFSAKVLRRGSQLDVVLALSKSIGVSDGTIGSGEGKTVDGGD